jgi:hypothetical protein
MNLSELFPIAEQWLSDAAEVFCDNCKWFGLDNETRDWDDFSRCPECNNTCTAIDRTITLEHDHVEDILKELLEQTLVFNRRRGYNCYSGRKRTHNARFEVDLHGQLQFRVMDWSLFYADRSSMDTYDVVKARKSIDLYAPEHIDITVLRDLLQDFADLVEKLDKQDFLEWCAITRVDPYDPDSRVAFEEARPL